MKLDRPARNDLFSRPAQRCRKVLLLQCRRAEIPNKFAGFSQALFCLLAQIVKAISYGSANRLREAVQLESETRDVLQQSVVHLARNPRPLGEPLFEADVQLPCHAAEAEAM